MQRAGVIGLGDMGSGLAKNLIANGFQTTGLDLSEARMSAFVDMGGNPAASAAEVGATADAVYVMVMNGDQAKAVILGPDGLVANMDKGGAVILSATIKPREAREIGDAMEGSGIHQIDTPVSGGFPGAQGGTLTMMAAAPDAILDEFAPVMEAVSASIHRVGTKPGYIDRCIGRERLGRLELPGDSDRFTAGASFLGQGRHACEPDDERQRDDDREHPPHVGTFLLSGVVDRRVTSRTCASV